MIFQPFQSNGNKHKQCFMQFEAKQCINRVFCQTTSKTINFKIPTSIFQTDKQKTQLLTNLKCKNTSATSEWASLLAIEWVRIVCCLKLLGPSLFCVCVCVTLCRTCNWIKKTCGFAELSYSRR